MNALAAFVAFVVFMGSMLLASALTGSGGTLDEKSFVGGLMLTLFFGLPAYVLVAAFSYFIWRPRRELGTAVYAVTGIILVLLAFGLTTSQYGTLLLIGGTILLCAAAHQCVLMTFDRVDMR